jgi:hypothetical protein
MKRTLLIGVIAIALSGLIGRADTKDKLLHATLVEELGGELKTSFESDVPKIYALWSGDAIKVGDKVRGVWIADDVGDAAPKNTKIDEATVTAAETNQEGNFSISKPDKGWPAGKYRLELYVGDKLAQTLKFSIGDDDAD